VRFTQAIVRPPGANFAEGISSATELGAPDVALARAQHEEYCETLRACGLRLTQLAVDLRHPDGTFVEDTAILTEEAAIVTRPGAQSREAEAAATLESLHSCFDTIFEIKAPGTVDGGDVCEVDGDFLIGLSCRTNPEGVRQLVALLTRLGHKSLVIDIRDSNSLLHLKTGLSYVGDGVFVVSSDGSFGDALQRYAVIKLPCAEAYAANCVRVNDRVLVAAGYPQLLTALDARGCRVTALAMSEFEKMDGGLSCLSLRF
jgi:dimethylargininase